jgi:hypothetical protein
MLLLLLVAILLAPLVLRAVWVLLLAHVWMVCLFLPAGLLLRLGPAEDMRVYAGVTVVWGLVLLWCRSQRRRAAA